MIENLRLRALLYYFPEAMASNARGRGVLIPVKIHLFHPRVTQI